MTTPSPLMKVLAEEIVATAEPEDRVAVSPPAQGVAFLSQARAPNLVMSTYGFGPLNPTFTSKLSGFGVVTGLTNPPPLAPGSLTSTSPIVKGETMPPPDN